MRFLMLLKADKTTEAGALPSRADVERQGDVPERESVVTDGPFAETKDLIAAGAFPKSRQLFEITDLPDVPKEVAEE